VLTDLDIGNIRDYKSAMDVIHQLLNLVESLNRENQELKRQLQELRDEINRLKGEQGKPTIRPKKGSSKNCSSENERKEPKEGNKGTKKGRIKIHNTQVCYIDKSVLPKDAQSKGYERVIVQDIKFEAHNTLFLKEKYYSPSIKKTYLAPLPPGYQGEFGPAIKSLALKLSFDTNVPQPKILDLLGDAGITLSAGQLSNFLIKNHDGFHKEKDALYEAGLKSTPWHHIDDTSTRVNGQNQYCQILCNPLYTAYFTTPNKSRLTVIHVLRNFGDLTFLLDEEAFGYVDAFKLPASVVQMLHAFPKNHQIPEQDFLRLIEKHLPNLGPQQHTHILDAAAVAAYHAQLEFPIIRMLLCDDAPQFKLITEALSLCWVHDGRLYKKLEPCIPYHQNLLDAFLDQYWDFYRQLLAYQQHPSMDDHLRLENEFDNLFSTVTGYYALDQRIAKTKDKKSALLMVLDHPEIPLHNNPAELAARTRVRKRVVSFGTRTKEGTKAWDTFMSLSATAKKLGVNFYSYLYDRISRSFNIPNLANIISQRAKELHLADSWDTSP
jgi:hypothetical protein